MERVYNKLVRDKIPEIIKGKGETPVIRVLDNDEYKKELELKLYEEYKEVLESNELDRLEELADMIEVIRALTILEGSTLEEVMFIADKKNEKRGSFNEKIYLEKVIEGE